MLRTEITNAFKLELKQHCANGMTEVTSYFLIYKGISLGNNAAKCDCDVDIINTWGTENVLRL